MEAPGGAALLPGGNVPAFLTKLWTLVEDPDTDPLICWSPGGTSFHVFDQARFSKEVLPKFFKHNNMASFIRQLNMYGFRKVVHIEHGGLVKPEKDDTEFQHPFFVRGQEHLLENIKRKVTNVSSVRHDEVKSSSDEVNKILNDVQLMKGKQETIDSRINAMKHENEALWREVATLRQKHAQQQKVVNKLIQFLVSLVQTNRILGVKRKIPLMLNDSSSAHSMPKYTRQFSLEPMQAAASLFTDSALGSGPIISDITEVSTPVAAESVSEWVDPGGSQTLNIKEEPACPEVEACSVLEGGAASVDTPLSPTTFINSLLQDSDTQPTLSTSTSSCASASGPAIVVMSPTSSGPLPLLSTSQSAASNATCKSTWAGAHQDCQTVACLDRPLPPPPAGGLSPDARRFLSTPADKSELSHHVDHMENSLENLQNIFNLQSFTFDTSPLIEFFGSPSSTGDFDIDTLDNLFADDAPKGSEGGSNSSNTGKQLVHYSTSPALSSEPISAGEGGADLPSLLELEEEPFLAPDPSVEDPAAAAALLGHAHLDTEH